MITKRKNDLKWFEFKLFQPFNFLKHGVFPRKGGFSKKPFSTFNLDLSFKNSPDIQKNFDKLKNVFEIEDIVFSKQVHGSKIIEITSQNKNQLFECDGFVTKEKNTALLIKHADCQAALFFDPHKKVLGAVHAGWKGQVLDIYKKMIQKMRLLYQSNPKDILVSISPSLGPKSAEFKNYRDEFPQCFWPFQTENYLFDLWQIGKYQLVNAGILEKNIEIAQIDTYQNKEDFFSYRREKITGRNATIIFLKDMNA